MKDSIKIGIVAGEHSGDILGENLLKSLKKIKNVEIFGVGGPKMEGQGLKSVFDFNNLNDFWWNNNKPINEKKIIQESHNDIKMRLRSFLLSIKKLFTVS